MKKFINSHVQIQRRAIKLLCVIPNKLDEEIIRVLSVPLSLEFVKFNGEDFLDVGYLEIRADGRLSW